MFESVTFIFGFCFGVSVMYVYCSKVNDLIKKLNVLHNDLAIFVCEWHKKLNIS